ncbi:MAG: CBS domain-containing protein, partial [Candidatus Krumholzibacteria bacterium]|nr:CBS domain-containing protein [Candidatus Krumholzibacteria bacterium]
MQAPQGEIDLRLRALLSSADHDSLRPYLKELLPAEIGESLESLDNEQRKILLSLLEADRAAEVFGGLEERVQEEMTDLLSEKEIAELLEEMESDEAADVVRLLEPGERARVLDLLGEETEGELRELLRHEEDTAGDLMMVELAALPETAILAEAIEHLRENQDEIRQLFNVYLVDASQRLVGSLALRDMVLARPGMPLKALMEPIHVTATPGMDQEEVARLFRKYDLVSLPVVNEENVLVGRITVDDIMEVMEEEATEDLSRFAGVSEPGFHAGTLFRLSLARLP